MHELKITGTSRVQSIKVTIIRCYNFSVNKNHQCHLLMMSLQCSAVAYIDEQPKKEQSCIELYHNIFKKFLSNSTIVLIEPTKWAREHVTTINGIIQTWHLH